LAQPVRKPILSIQFPPAQLFRGPIAWIMLLALMSSLLCVPYFSYKIWRHQYRMSFKSEATNYYASRPELFKTFDYTPEFQNKINILKPHKEFALNDIKFDVLDTVYDELGISQLICVQDADEMALEQLVRSHTQNDHSSKTAGTTQDWIKIYKWLPHQVIILMRMFHAVGNYHSDPVKQFYTNPTLNLSKKPPNLSSLLVVMRRFNY
jgi:hypothetical protein